MHRTFPWKVESCYKPKHLRESAYEALTATLDKSLVNDPTVGRQTVIRNIGIWRSTQKRGNRKVEKSAENESDADDIDSYSLWYYDFLQFVEEQKPSRHTVSNISQVSVTLCLDVIWPPGLANVLYNQLTFLTQRIKCSQKLHSGHSLAPFHYISFTANTAHNQVLLVPRQNRLKTEEKLRLWIVGVVGEYRRGSSIV